MVSWCVRDTALPRPPNRTFMSTAPPPIDPVEIEAAGRSLICARTTNLGIEVQMPLIYPSGNGVTVIVVDEGETCLVHDAGFGAMELELAGMGISKKVRVQLARQASIFGCEFSQSRMWLRCPKARTSLGIAMVANASKLVGDQSVELRALITTDFKKEVAHLMRLSLGEDRVKIDDGVLGDSGINYKMKIVLLNQEKTAPQAFVETVSEQKAVNAPFRAFYDIQKNASLRDIRRLSVYDDRHQWRPGDLILLQDVSAIVPFTTAQMHLDRVLN